MEHEITESEALRLLSLEETKYSRKICAKYDGTKMPGRDGAYTQELRLLHNEFGERYCKIKKAYENNVTLSKDDVMKIVTGEV